MKMNYLMIVICMATGMMFYGPFAAADLPYNADLAGMVTTIEYDGQTTTYEYDSYGNITIMFTLPQVETEAFEYSSAGEYNIERIYKITPAGDEDVVRYEYDALGRATDEAFPDAVVHFDYDIGIMTRRREMDHVGVTFNDGGTIDWSCEKELAEKTYRVSYEKKKAGAAIPERSGQICYYLTDDQGLLKAITHGDTGETTTYEYDAEGRLTALMAPEPTNLSFNSYDPNGMLAMVNSSVDARDAVFQYEYDALGRVTRIVSDTAGSDPNFIGLGHLVLTYEPDTERSFLKEIAYTANEVILVIPPVISTFQYEADALCRITRMTCSTPGQSDLIVTFDPNIPQTGSYMVTQYEYDSLGRLLWIVDTCGDYTRRIYSDLLDGFAAELPRMEIGRSRGFGFVMSKYEWEYDVIAKETDDDCDFSDMRGRYCTQEKSRPQVTAHQISQPNWWGGRFARTIYGSPDEENPRGKMIWMTIDEFGNQDLTIGEKIKYPDQENSPLLRHKVFGKKKEEKEAAFIACKEPLEADLTGDCVVNLKDFTVLADAWLGDQSPSPDDL
jgi:YD repeat-containing protein